MKNLPWLSNYIEDWHKSIVAKTIPHAILIMGSKGLAKVQLANIMAKSLLCESQSGDMACGACPSCLLIDSNSHLDLIQIRAENSIIKVDQIRKLSHDVSLSTTRNKYKVVIIENAENLNVSAANALLKTLEEPPESTIIILSCSDSSQLLPTIKSRCLKLNVSNPNRKLIENWLIDRNSKASKDDINLSLILTNNAVISADQILQNNQLESIKSMIVDLYDLLVRKTSVLELRKKWIESEYYELSGYISNYLLMLIKRKMNIDCSELFKNDTLFNFLTQIPNLEIRMLNFINSNHIFLKRLNTPLKKELLIEELLINWQNI